jgi:hypothetical protein
MKLSIAEIEAARQKAATVDEYIDSMSKLYRWKFLQRKDAYQPNVEALEGIKGLAEEYFVLAFSAQWCKDCSQNIPVLGLVSGATGLEVQVLGGIKTDPLSKDCLWAIPPSPPEVLSFCVEKLPWIILFDQQGNEVGKIVENPEHTGSIEEELLYFMREDIGS